MLRKEFEIPKSVLGDIINFNFYQTKDFRNVTLTKDYEDMEIRIHFEKSTKMDALINMYIGVVIGDSYPFTFRFEFLHLVDLFKVFCLELKNDKLLLKIIPQGGRLKPQEYVLFRPLLEQGMSSKDLINYATHISFNDNYELCYLCYNLLLNNDFIIFEPHNVKTDLNLKSLLTDKFEYYGYNEEYLENNKNLKDKTTFKRSQEVIEVFIVYVLEVLLNNDKSGFDKTRLNDLFKSFYDLVEK